MDDEREEMFNGHDEGGVNIGGMIAFLQWLALELQVREGEMDRVLILEAPAIEILGSIGAGLVTMEQFAHTGREGALEGLEGMSEFAAGVIQHLSRVLVESETVKPWEEKALEIIDAAKERGLQLRFNFEEEEEKRGGPGDVIVA